MTLDTTLESTRLTIQSGLDASKSKAERNKLGQFATPTVLANDILSYVHSVLPARLKIRFLDPASGTGSFYSALLNVFPTSRIDQAIGYEIDPLYQAAAAQLWKNTPLVLRLADFTRAVPPQPAAEKFNLIICNPPYVRHHHLTSADKERLQRRVYQLSGLRLSGLTGLYSYFLCLAHAWLADDGLAGWLIPSEFMDVNYGRAIKDYLTRHVTLLRIHRFDPNDVQFEDALVSSAVVWFKKSLPPDHHQVEFSYGGTLIQPATSKRVPLSVLKETPKWTKYPLASITTRQHSSPLRLGDLFKIQRGIATSANEFFIVTPEQVAACHLPEEYLLPILPSPRFLNQNEIEADATGAPLIDRRQYLLNCNLPEEAIKRQYPALWQYLQRGMADGIPERYLCRHRTPWYAQEARLPAPILCTYMGRRDESTGHPFRFVLNHSRAIAPNVYLMLYPKPNLAAQLKEQPERIMQIWQALNTLTPETLIGEGRVYGGGLHKLEPNELANAPADAILEVVPELFAKPDGQLRLLENKGPYTITPPSKAARRKRGP